MRADLVGLDELYRRSDFISCHVPESPQTLGMFNERAFSQMKPTAFFINTSRGKVVNEEALIERCGRRRLPAPRWTCERRNRPNRRR